jgi:hypothetical protein
MPSLFQAGFGNRWHNLERVVCNSCHLFHSSIALNVYEHITWQSTPQPYYTMPLSINFNISIYYYYTLCCVCYWPYSCWLSMQIIKNWTKLLLCHITFTCTSSIKGLGVFFDSKLHFHEHLDYVFSDRIKRLGLIRSITYRFSWSVCINYTLL